MLYIPDLPYSMTSRPDMDWREKRAFNFFRNRTAEELGGYFSPDLWSKFVLATAHYEDAAKDAVVSIGSLHELFLKSFQDTDPPLHAFAMQHYGKAMQHVVQLDTNTSMPAAELALTMSILFACIEIIQKQFASSLNHIYSGMKILAELARKGQPPSEHYVPRHLLIQMYLRIDTQVMEFGREGFQAPAEFAITSLTPVPEAFTETEIALSCLEMYRYQILHLVHDVETSRANGNFPGKDSEPIHQRYRLLQLHLNKWKQAYHSMRLKARNRDLPMLILEVSSMALDIVLATSLEPNEMAFDLFTDKFREIVTLCDEVVENAQQGSRVRNAFHSLQISPKHFPLRNTSSTTNPPTPEPVLSMSVGVVSLLYMTATRCRESRIRRKALSLLRSIKRREGLCDSDMLADLAERLIITEEEGAQDRLWVLVDDCNPQQHPTELVSAKQVPESVRVRISEHFPGDSVAVYPTSN